MTPHKFRCLVAVKAGKRAAANTFWKNNIDRVGGENTFTQGLSASGNAPATWYWCSTALAEWQLRKVVQVADANSSDVRIVIWAYRSGVKAKLTELMGNRNYITIADGEQSPQSFLDAVGMKLVNASQT